MTPAILELGRKLLGAYRCRKAGCTLDLRPASRASVRFRIACREHGTIRYVQVADEVLALAMPMGPSAVARAVADALVRATIAVADDAVEAGDLDRATRTRAAVGD